MRPPYESVAEAYTALTGHPGVPDTLGPGSCHLWAVAAYLTYREYGVPVTLQAGSMHWPITGEGSGVSGPTHFSYTGEAVQRNPTGGARPGALSDMYCWVADCRTREIMDYNTGNLQAHAVQFAGVVWRAPAPPKFLACPIDNLPEGVLYVPHMQATALATSLALSLLTHYIRPSIAHATLLGRN